MLTCLPGLIQYSCFAIYDSHEYMILETEIGIYVIYSHIYLIWIMKSWFDTVIYERTKVDLLYYCCSFILEKLWNILTADVSIWEGARHFCAGTEFTIRYFAHIVGVTIDFFLKAHVETYAGTFVHICIVAFSWEVRPWYLRIDLLSIVCQIFFKFHLGILPQQITAKDVYIEHEVDKHPEIYFGLILNLATK